MLNLRSLIGDLPSVLQYVIVLALVMALLYVALWLTRRIGSHFNSEKVTYDDPEKYAESVPDLFATTEFRKGKAKAKGKQEAPKEDAREHEQDLDSDSDQD